MIAESFSRLALTPCQSAEAISLPEIVFGVALGKQILGHKRGGTPAPLLLYDPKSLVAESPVVVGIEEEDGGWQWINVMGRVEVPVGKTVDCVDLEVLYDVPLYTCDDTDVDAPVLEELAVWPEMTLRETLKLRALHYLRRWVCESRGATGSCDVVEPIPPELVPTLGEIGKKVWLSDDDGKLWKLTRRGLRVEIVVSADRLRDVLLMCHEGMGHRQLGAVYDYFSKRYWVPAAVKFIKRHILACAVCQQFAADVTPPVPGFSASAKDVFTHWSIDFAGPFPPDTATGHRYIVVAVEWVTRWAEAEVVADATAATAADFIYSRIITRYGCVESIQSDNGPHFVNEVIRNLTQTLGVRHRLSTPYYPQSNGKVERVIGTIKSMLKRTVAAAAHSQRCNDVEADGIRVVGIGLDLDTKILDAIAAVKKAPVVSEVEDVPVMDADVTVHWSPLLHTVLWVYRATPHSVTGLSPALLALGRELRLPMDLQASMESDVAPLTDVEHRELIARRLHWITDRIDGLQELCHGRRDSSSKYEAQFQLGQKVWKREPKYDGKGKFVPVFAPRWTGPFVIHSVYDKNVYKLRTIPDDTKKVGYLKNPVNGHRLKPYIDSVKGDNTVMSVSSV